MHLLPLASRDHIFQRCKLLVHFRPSSPLDQAMCCSSRDLTACCSCGAWLLLFRAIPICRCILTILSFAHTRVSSLLVLPLGFDLDNLSSPCRGRRQFEIRCGPLCRCALTQRTSWRLLHAMDIWRCRRERREGSRCGGCVLGHGGRRKGKVHLTGGGDASVQGGYLR